MTLPAPLIAAIEVFRELGWHEASPEQIMDLPLGTPEQQRVAKTGLAKGEWGAFGQIGERTYGWISWVDVDEDMLGAFAVRVGVPVKRAAAVMPGRRDCPPELRGRLIASRGPEFTTAFAAAGGRASWHGVALLHAVTATGVEVPDNLAYLETWVHVAAATLGADEETPDDVTVPLAVLQTRYADHLRAALRSGNPAPREAGVLVGGGVERGWIGLDEARQLVLFAMEQAQRPIDRKTWAAVLTDTLGATPEWLLEHAGVILSVVSFGDDAIITRFTPVLLASGDDELIMQAMLIGLTAKSAKAKAALLEVAAATPPPGVETTAVVAEAVAPLLSAKDRKVSRRAQALVDAWSLGAEPLPDEEAEEVRGLWQPTPPAAEVPCFDPGPVTSEHLTALASALMQSRNDERVTLDVERFLATANALAHADPDAARIALRGVKGTGGVGVVGVAEWVKGTPTGGLDRFYDDGSTHHSPPFHARSASVFQRLGSVGALLSTPSWDDYRIHPAELADRLDAYAAAGVPALKADLQVALPRIDLAFVDNGLASRLVSASVPVLLQDGSTAPRTVGEILGAWLREPLEHPGFRDEQSTVPLDIVPVPAIEGLPPRLTYAYLWVPIPLFPTWPDARISFGDGDPATLRAYPNGAVPSTQLLDTVGEDGVDLGAPIAAWRNGMLRPGIAEAPRLGWRGQISSLASRAAAWTELAEAGLLSVVWPLAADVIAYSSGGPRVAPGVAELVELLTRFLPEVRTAISTGIADTGALALPGVRRLAERAGSSRAVVAARALVALLPEAPATNPVTTVPELSEEDFRAAWPVLADPPVIPDGATVTVDACSGARGSYLEPTVTLADGSVHRIASMHWTYPLVHEQQVPSGSGARSTTWLRYSAREAALVAAEGREAYRGEDDRLLSHTLATVLCLTQFVQPDAPEYNFYAAIADGDLGRQRVAAVIDDLLAREGVDPYPLVRRLARHPQALPAMYPVLTRAIRHAAALDGKPPRWLVRILDVATGFAPVLREAVVRGLLATEDAAWPGLAEIADDSASPAVRRKAALLRDALGLG